jgi:hypothetical protein
MLEQQNRSPRKKTVRYLIVCEGDTEKWFFDEVLITKFFKINKASHSNVRNVIDDASKLMNSHNKSDSQYSKCFCVYDKDKVSNTIDQLNDANKMINESNGKLVRVFSTPYFEVVFICNFRNHSRVFSNDSDFNKCLNDHLKENKMPAYTKTEKIVKQIAQAVNIRVIANNSSNMHKKLQQENMDMKYNYHNTDYCYTEIYKILEILNQKLENNNLKLAING